MDPAMILALTNTCVSLAVRLATLSNQLYGVAERYKQAQRTISFFDVQLAALAGAARALHRWLGRPAVQHSHLHEDLKKSLDACEELVTAIMEQLAEWQGKSNKISFWTKTKYLWDEPTIMRYESMLRGQVQALSLLLQVIKLPTQDEQDTLIKSEQNSTILARARDESSSLLWLRDAESTRTCTSVMTDNLETMDVKFDFDEMIVASKVYRSALASFLRQGILRDNKGKANSIRSGVRPMAISSNAAEAVLHEAERPSSSATLTQPELSGTSSKIIKTNTESSDHLNRTASDEVRFEQSLKTRVIDNEIRIEAAQAVVATLFPKSQGRNRLSASASTERLGLNSKLTESAENRLSAPTSVPSLRETPIGNFEIVNHDAETHLNASFPIIANDPDDDGQDLMSVISSSPEISEEDIDFEFVYALHSFTATIEGQVTARKGATLILLDDGNSYWWLVRVVSDGGLGYMPAEYIETPTERLARLNKHRNLDSFNASTAPEKGLIASIGIRGRRAVSKHSNLKKVTFARGEDNVIGSASYESSDDDGP